MDEPGQDDPDPRTGAIIGAVLEVHLELGPGYLEKVYHLALMHEMRTRGLRFDTEVVLPIYYKGHRLATAYRADLIVEGDILVELKAVETLTKVHSAQVIHYLSACRVPVGLLLNFAAPRLAIRRFVGPAHFQPQGPPG